METVITLIFLGLIVWWVAVRVANQNKATQDRREQCQRLLEKAFPEVQKWHEMCWGTIDRNFVLMRIDDTEGDVYFVYFSNSRIEKYSKKYILSSEVIENGQSIASAKRMSQIAWGVTGGLVAGAPGAVIGGLGTAHKTKEYVNSIILRVGFIDADRPVREIPFLGLRVKSGSGPHIAARNNALEWHNRFQASIRKADWESGETATGNNQSQIVDGSPDPKTAVNAQSKETITRLADLYQEGLLTREEFEIEKRRIINSE